MDQKPLRKFFSQQLLSRIPGWFFALLVIASLTSTGDRKTEDRCAEWEEAAHLPVDWPAFDRAGIEARDELIALRLAFLSPYEQAFTDQNGSAIRPAVSALPPFLFIAASARPRSPPIVPSPALA